MGLGGAKAGKRARKSTSFFGVDGEEPAKKKARVTKKGLRKNAKINLKKGVCAVMIIY